MGKQRIPKQSTDYRLEELDGELMIYHPAKTNTLYLNETAAMVWQLCDGVRTKQEIVDLLRDSFPDATDAIEDDVQEALNQLEEMESIHYGDADTTSENASEMGGIDVAETAGSASNKTG